MFCFVIVVNLSFRIRIWFFGGGVGWSRNCLDYFSIVFVGFKNSFKKEILYSF